MDQSGFAYMAAAPGWAQRLDGARDPGETLWGRRLIEAMACRRHVFVILGDVPEGGQKGESGHLFGAGDYGGTAIAVRARRADRTRWQQMSPSASQDVRTRFLP